MESSVIGDSLRDVESKRAACLNKADNLLPQTAKLLASVADAPLSVQQKELGCSFREFVLSLKDPKGKPRNIPWARHLVNLWRSVERYKSLAEAVLEGHSLNRAAMWVRVAEHEEWAKKKQASLGPGEMNKSIAIGLTSDYLVTLLKTKTWAEAEARAHAISPKQKDKCRMGGSVLPGTKERWMECWKGCAALLDRQAPDHPAFEWQLETVMMVAEEVMDAARKVK